jgi:prepilin-type N-terminal cleavage/methylation domain-containing protein/prepilin-type processing-associated H-X9-DG protein
MRLRTLSTPRGFTLIELLVVICIITMLIGILLPALGKARDAGRGSVCLSNSRGNGQALHIYLNDSGGYLPTAYQYRLTNDFNSRTIGSSSSTGYLQWSGVLMQGGYYSANSPAFVCPGMKDGGWAPTNFARPGDAISTANTDVRVEPPGNQTSQTAGLVDTQASRLSYVPNEALMPRRKTAVLAAANQLRLVRAEEIDKASGTIMLAEYTDFGLAIQGNSSSGGFAYKTHRPTNGVSDGGSAVYNGESVPTGNTTNDVRALTIAQAKAAIDSCNPALGGTSNNDEHAHHIAYVSPDRHGAGSNYTFADGHGENRTLERTLDPTDFAWGLKMYSQRNKPRVTIDGATPVY